METMPIRLRRWIPLALAGSLAVSGCKGAHVPAAVVAPRVAAAAGAQGVSTPAQASTTTSQAVTASAGASTTPGALVPTGSNNTVGAAKIDPLAVTLTGRVKLALDGAA